MTESWDEMRKAKEDQFFEKANKDAMARIAKKEQLKSPVSGEPMIQETAYGVVIERCPTSGGIWLDKGELEKIIEQAKGHVDGKEGYISQFFNSLLKGKLE